jgi:NADH:ubiquinone oxidoreductase subunit E
MRHMAQEVVETDAIVQKYGGDKSMLIQILLEIQRRNRWLSEDDLRVVSESLDVPDRKSVV